MVRLDYLLSYWIVGADYRAGPFPTRDAALRALDARVKATAA
jgi:hypothetical protein